MPVSSVVVEWEAEVVPPDLFPATSQRGAVEQDMNYKDPDLD
jgi:hypothetical protein